MKMIEVLQQYHFFLQRLLQIL